MIQEIEIPLDGTINRRDPGDKLTEGQVRARENFLVTGIGESKHNQKMLGSDRLTTSALSKKFTWASRYYSGQIAKTFAFSNGTIYHISEAGTATAKKTNLNPSSYPSNQIMKVSGNNVMYLVDGFNGMYSHDGNIGQEWNKENSVELNFVQILSHLDRMVGFEEDSEDLYISANLNPTNYTDSTDAIVITIGAKRGAKIMAIALLNETLYIFKQDSIWVLEGSSPSTFSVREVHPSLGTAARWSVKVGKSGGIFFLGSDYEFYVTAGTQGSTQLLSYNLCVAGEGIHITELINKSHAFLAVGTFHKDLYRCSFTETGKVENNLEYIWNTINKTDSLTRGNNVSCYAIYDKSPDTGDLITGRSDTGHLMIQYRGLNWDNQASSPTMPYKLASGFIPSGIRNTRFLRFWAKLNVRGAYDITVKTQLDTRLAVSDYKSNTVPAQGETKGMTNLLRINNQESITSRAVLPWLSSKGNSISFIIDEDLNNRDINITSFVVEAIVTGKKRSKYVQI